jgi:hypothetical protein
LSQVETLQINTEKSVSQHDNPPAEKPEPKLQDASSATE